MCERGHGGTRPGIHYRAFSNIMIQAHARQAFMAAGKKSRGWRRREVTSPPKACGGGGETSRHREGVKLISVFHNMHSVSL